MANVIRLKKDDDIEQLKEKLENAQISMKGIDVQKYSGIITLKEDPIEYQKRMRNEWN